MKRNALFALTLIAVLAIALPCAAKDYQAMQRLIDQSGAAWTVGHTSLSEYSRDQMGLLCNLDFAMPVQPASDLDQIELSKDIPAHLDWRDFNGNNYMTPIKDQHPCGTCATFSSVGATEALLKIAVDNPFVEPDISEQHIYSCAGEFPYTFFHPLNVLQGQGAPDETCFPYDCPVQGYRPPCEDSCADWASRTFFIDGYQALMFPTTEQILTAVQDGPVVAGFQVFSDFQDYTGGVYEHVYGELLGGHGVVIAGYDMAEQYWICKNSWGTQWGEEGWFKIRWSTELLGFGYQTFDIFTSYESFCGQHVEPTIGSLELLNAGPELAQGEQLEVRFEFIDTDADMRGGELWHQVDEGEAQRFAEPLREFVGTQSDPLDLPSFSFSGDYAPGPHTLKVWLADVCGLQSTQATVEFTVEGEVPGDDDDDESADDDDDDDSSCGC
ncbi:MAG: C1 family peptidase [Candidatus Alcyoniella australis]|nr:C1 family peptidase [Candidatus Alcyoniella australis]